MKKKTLIDATVSSASIAEVCRKVGLPNNGIGYRRIKALLTEHEIDTSHLSHKAAMQRANEKWKLVNKSCPVCTKLFETKAGHPREKQTCSSSCANTFFRSGKNNPNWKESAYRTTCFHHHGKKCLVCKETKIVTVHHVNENHDDNRPENLVPLCPTHHQYLHSRYADEVRPIVDAYVKLFVEGLTNNDAQHNILV